MAKQTLELRLRRGDVIGRRWTVEKKLGEGGCGSVYLAQDGDQPVAVKFLEHVTDKVDRARFQREIDILKGAPHNRRRDKPSHIIRYIHHGVHNGFPYLVMEFAAGGSVRDLLDKKKRLSLEDACWIVIQAIRGLRKANTWHRDLKPENLLVSAALDGGSVRISHKDGKPGAPWKGSVVKVADFGLAKAADQKTALTMSKQVMGTPLYMAPEQCRQTKNAVETADVYALGVMLFELVTGKVPFEGESAYDTMTMHCTAAVPWPADMDPTLKVILARCLAKKPEERWRKLADLERQLCHLAGLDEPLPDPFPWGWVVAGAAFAMVLIVVAVFFNRFAALFDRLL